MATLPSASTTVSTTTGAPATGDDLITVLGCVPSNADMVPRLYANPAAIYSYHGYSEALEYAALHIQETRKPVLFVGLPIDTEGAIGREDNSGNTGTSVATVAAASGGVLHEHDGQLTVRRGGTIGTSQIELLLSLDGGRSTQVLRLGTDNSVTLPYVGVTVSFAAGTLVADDVIHTWHGSAPTYAVASLATARANLAAQSKTSRSWIVIGDCSAAQASAVVTQANAYETSNERFTFARVSVPDRLPAATLSTNTRNMSGGPNVTFAEVGATGDTITRASGSFVADGFAVGDLINVTGSASNNITAVAGLTAVSATVLTLDTDDLADEGPVGGVSIVSHASLTFANVAETVTRNRGSWLDDGFRVGDLVTISGTSGGTNDVVGAEIQTLTDTVMTLDAGDVAADEVIRATSVTITAGQTKAVWVAAEEAAFASIDGEPRVDLAFGRARKLSPFSSWLYRRPASWAASVREYQHDLHITTWRKSDGPLSGWDLNDADGNLYEFDERIDGGALAGRFTCFRTYANGPNGTFIAMSLTREAESDPRSYTHNMAVVNAGQTIVHRETENFIGETPILDADGHATADELAALKSRVDRALQLGLLQNVRGEGQRCSNAYWTPADDDVLNVPGATLNGVMTLALRGTIVNVATTIKVS